MIETLEKEPLIKRKIFKAKLAKNGGVEVEFEQTLTIEKPSEKPFNINSYEGSKREPFPHEDLVLAFSLLRSHLAFICDLPETRDKELHQLDDDVEALERIKVTGFSIGGNGESEGVTLIGFKRLKGGRLLNLSTPFTKYVDESGEGYEYAAELSYLMNHVTDEVELYIDGKIAPDAQQEMEFPEREDINEFE